MSGIYCAFCYFGEDKKVTAQEILTSEKVEKAFVMGSSTEGRAKAYELAERRVGYATRLLNDKLIYHYGYFSVEPGDVRQEGVTITKEFEDGCPLL